VVCIILPAHRRNRTQGSNHIYILEGNIDIRDVYPFEYPMPRIELESLEIKSACLLGFVGAMLKAGSDNSKLSDTLKISLIRSDSFKTSTECKLVHYREFNFEVGEHIIQIKRNGTIDFFKNA
jgi:hypothetical protein